MGHILIVEDDEQLNEVLCYNFSKAGYQVSSALDGDEAVRQLAENPPDLILLDLMLPSTSGWEVCRQLSERQDLREVRVVVHTAKSGRTDFDRARNFPNFAGYFVKPYATADAMRHVKKILADRKRN